MTPDRSGLIHSYLKGAAIFAALFVWAFAAVAQNVTLRSVGGGLELEGRVIGYDGRHLRLETEYGVLTLNYAGLICSGDACPVLGVDPPILRFSGNARMANVILPALVEGYARETGLSAEQTASEDGWLTYTLRNNSGQAVLALWYRPTTTTAGFADLLAHDADVLVASRALTASEGDQAQAAGFGLLDSPQQMILLALEGQVPIVSPRSGLRELDLNDVARALSGEVTNWAQIGGPDMPISVHLPVLDDGLARAFVDRILSGVVSGDARFHATAAEVAETVAVEPGGLGVVSVLSVVNAQPVTLRDQCGFVARPSAEMIKTEDYPLAFPLYLYLPRRHMSDAALGYFDWLTSPEAQVILRRSGVVTQSPVPIVLGQQGQRLAAAIEAAGPEVRLADLQAMIGALQGRARLSLTFRFDEGERQLDLTSQLHARFLAQAIAAGDYDGQSLLLVGFSDSEGPAAINRRLSLTRANAVRDAVLQLLGGALPGGVRLQTAGFGEALPVGCDDTHWGRQANRRVELWTGRSE